MRRSGLVAVAAAFVTGAVVASLLTMRVDWWPAASAARDARPCSEVLVAGADWLRGAGVDVHSNGEHQTTGTSCANNDQAVYDLAASPPMFGFGWQCVELVNRLYATRGWFPRLWLGADTNTGAKWLYTYAERGKYEGLTAHANGSGYRPVPGDLIVHNSGTYGHVSVVDRVDGTTLHAVEQNNSVTGWAEYAYEPTTGAVTRGSATISGFIHAAKNQGAAPGGQPPNASAPTTQAPRPDGDLAFRVVGTCTSVGGELKAESSGFTPGGQYSVAAWLPGGKPYPGLRTEGTVKPDGSVSWRWPCKGDAPGTYGTTLVDLSTGRTTGEVYFRIDAPRRQPPDSVPQPEPPPVESAPNPPAPPPPAPPKPTVSNLIVVLYGGGHVGVAYDVGWQAGRDPVTCHFFIDGQEVFTAQCGTHSSKQFYGISPGQHEFYATVSDRFGVYSDPTTSVVRQVT